MKSSHSVLADRAIADTDLTAKALGIFLRLLRSYPDGAIPSAATLAEGMREGRDAIQAALRELIEAGYVTRTRVPMPNGAYRTDTYIASATGKPLAQQETTLLASTTTKPVTTRSTTKPLGVTYNRNTFGVSGAPPSGRAPESESKSMAWNTREPEDEGGCLNPWRSEPEPSKPAHAPRKVAPPKRVATGSGTASKAGQSNARGLLKEFIDRAVLAAPRRVGQVNKGALGKTFKTWLDQGVHSAAIRSGMDLFFEDPRNLAEVGNGRPLWLMFRIFFENNQARAAQVAGVEKSALDQEVEDALNGGPITVGKRAF